MEIATTCPYCGVGCGILGGVTSETKGDPSHPANFGKLCSKGGALHETLGLEGRLLVPKIAGRDATWSQAIEKVARNFRACIDKHGPDSVAFYVSGQILTEDYYMANKLMKGFIGSGNIDTNSRLCMASAVAAHNLAFGEDVVPGTYEDLELADLIVFAGHNAAWTHPVLHRRMEAQRARGQIHVVIDPRQTDTAIGADLHLALRPQTDVRLWNGLAAYLLDKGGVDQAYVAAHTNGFSDLMSGLGADDQSISAVAHDCGLLPANITRFYQLFLETPKTVTLFSQGLNQSTQGVDNGLAVINAHLLTGRVSKPGASPFSITGQPNAMGGRETGGMATTLAAHLGFSDDGRATAARFWGVPHVAPKPGLKAVEMFEAVASGKIKALWVMATNPALSLPDSNMVEFALQRCSFLGVSEVIANTETTRHAHVLLPALAWGEKDGTVTNSERTISRQRAFLTKPGDARADWDIIAQVARAMGYDQGFNHQSSAEVFAEFAAMTNFENDGKRALCLGRLAKLTDNDYDKLQPTRWPVEPSGTSIDRPFQTGRFSHKDGKARLISVTCAGPKRATTHEFPLSLNTGRLRDQWHTMTRTGLSGRLMRHAPEPVVDVHPNDAERFSLNDGTLAQIETSFGNATLRVRVSANQRQGEIFVPMHFSDAFAPGARANKLTNPDVDKVSGQPEFKHTPAKISPAIVTWRGFLVVQDRLDPTPDVWWARTPEITGHLYEINGLEAGPTLLAYLATLKASFPKADIIETSDSATSFVRIAFLVDDCLIAVFAGSIHKGLPQRTWLLEQLGKVPDDTTRIQLLTGGAIGASNQHDRTPIVCACFGVTLPQIEAYAAANPHEDVNAVGRALKAGTNCGSCRGEILSALKNVSARMQEASDHEAV
jgi:assimilatory nitrate reductase catalytic subunit